MEPLLALFTISSSFLRPCSFVPTVYRIGSARRVYFLGTPESGSKATAPMLFSFISDAYIVGLGIPITSSRPFRL